MNKSEKQIAAMYLSGCMNEARIAAKNGDSEAEAKALNDYKAYCKKLRDLLGMKFEMFGTDYEKSVHNPLLEINKITLVFYSQRVNGQELKYPA